MWIFVVQLRNLYIEGCQGDDASGRYIKTKHRKHSHWKLLGASNAFQPKKQNQTKNNNKQETNKQTNKNKRQETSN